MKLRVFLIAALVLVTLGFAPLSFADGKEFACHITDEYTDEDGVERYGGHVISIAESAVEAHCSHAGVSDHYPIGRVADAMEFCDDLLPDPEDPAYDKCLTKFAVGEFCSRKVVAVRPVEMLCDGD